MAIEDIVYGTGNTKGDHLIVEVVAGILNSPNDVLFETSSRNDIPVMEIQGTERFGSSSI